MNRIYIIKDNNTIISNSYSYADSIETFRNLCERRINFFINNTKDTIKNLGFVMFEKSCNVYNNLYINRYIYDINTNNIIIQHNTTSINNVYNKFQNPHINHENNNYEKVIRKNMENDENNIKTNIIDNIRKNTDNNSKDSNENDIFDKDIFNIDYDEENDSSDDEDNEDKIDDDIKKLEIINEFIDSDSSIETDSESEINEDELSEQQLILKKELENIQKMRNEMKKNIKLKEKKLEFVNNKLTDDIYEKRCKENEEKLRKKKENERKSILSYDKKLFITFLNKMKNKNKGEEIIPSLFFEKYIIIKYMAKNDMLVFKNDDDLEIEEIIFNNFHKVVKSYELNLHNNNVKNDPIEDIDNEMIDECNDFMEYLITLDKIPETEQKIHDDLNKEMDLDNKEQVFFKDTKKEDYEN